MNQKTALGISCPGVLSGTYTVHTNFAVRRGISNKPS